MLVHSNGFVKISDFGMSKAHLKDMAASSVGTLYYMSPERCQSNEYLPTTFPQYVFVTLWSGTLTTPVTLSPLIMKALESDSA